MIERKFFSRLFLGKACQLFFDQLAVCSFHCLEIPHINWQMIPLSITSDQTLFPVFLFLVFFWFFFFRKFAEQRLEEMFF